jgi:hypothetical protein
MNILRIIESKSVTFVLLLLFFIFLGIVSQKDSKFVGFGFGFLWLMSFLSENMSYCVIGAFGFTCFMYWFMNTDKEPFSAGERCNPTCFMENRAISTAYDRLSKVRDQLTLDKEQLGREKEQLGREKDQLGREKTALTKKNNDLIQLVTTVHQISSA